MKGYVQVYTGDGKGKTTAALGLIVRAAGAGLRTYLGQFIKGRPSGELKLLAERFPEVVVEQFGRGCFVVGKPTPEDIAAAQHGLESVRQAMAGGRYDLVIADELNGAVSAGLLPIEAVLQLVGDRPETVELVITGRGADRRLIERADLVTEMQAVKHYFRRGTAARAGIEE